MNSAQRAVRTKKARRELESHYGSVTLCVLDDLARGLSDEDVMWFNAITRETLSAVKAHVTRGTYGRLLRDCNF